MSNARSKPPPRSKFSGIPLRQTITPTVTRHGTVRGEGQPSSKTSDIAEETEEESQTLPGGWEHDTPDRLTQIARQTTGYVPVAQEEPQELDPDSFLARVLAQKGRQDIW
ncbi:hypothetical protein AURDEDRAFT_162823 [Auricularia subglabra TFB-10046 SS5]|nr:hypothetical protein AURDEDRAFT_162823 [Auricularia subglabra TFB-10046 SS5]